MVAPPLTAEDLASAVRALLDKVDATLEAQRESAHRQDAFAARMETLGARLDQHAERQDAFAARLDQTNERIDHNVERLIARLDRMEEQLHTVYEIVTRKSAGFGP